MGRQADGPKRHVGRGYGTPGLMVGSPSAAAARFSLASALTKASRGPMVFKSAALSWIASRVRRPCVERVMHQQLLSAVKMSGGDRDFLPEPRSYIVEKQTAPQVKLGHRDDCLGGPGERKRNVVRLLPGKR